MQRWSLALVLALVACGPGRPREVPLLDARSEAPGFDLQDLAGVHTRLSDLLRHGPAVLVFYRGFW